MDPSCYRLQRLQVTKCNLRWFFGSSWQITWMCCDSLTVVFKCTVDIISITITGSENDFKPRGLLGGRGVLSVWATLSYSDPVTCVKNDCNKFVAGIQHYHLFRLDNWWLGGVMVLTYLHSDLHWNTVMFRLTEALLFMYPSPWWILVPQLHWWWHIIMRRHTQLKVDWMSFLSFLSLNWELIQWEFVKGAFWRLSWIPALTEPPLDFISLIKASLLLLCLHFWRFFRHHARINWSEQQTSSLWYFGPECNKPQQVSHEFVFEWNRIKYRSHCILYEVRGQCGEIWL